MRGGGKGLNPFLLFISSLPIPVPLPRLFNKDKLTYALNNVVALLTEYFTHLLFVYLLIVPSVPKGTDNKQQL